MRGAMAGPAAGRGDESPAGAGLHVQDNETVVARRTADRVIRHHVCFKGRFGHQHGQNRD
ncbi:hypothetical protein [Streptomyces alfalfae]